MLVAWLDAVAGDAASLVSRGGMKTKVFAARRAARSGATTIIASGRSEDVLARLSRGEQLGTLLVPDQAPLVARKQWLANQLQVCGSLVLDAGAVDAVCRRNSSLLGVGVTAVHGEFSRGELVACLTPENREIARGLVNYNATEARRIKGHPSASIEGSVRPDQLGLGVLGHLVGRFVQEVTPGQVPSQCFLATCVVL